MLSDVFCKTISASEPIPKFAGLMEARILLILVFNEIVEEPGRFFNWPRPATMGRLGSKEGRGISGSPHNILFILPMLPS